MTDMKTKTRIDLSDLQIGTSASCTLTVTEREVDAFARLSFDDNELHMNPEFAVECGFPGRVAHGMIALAMISRLIGTQLPGHGSLWMSQETHFTEPVMLGDRLEARVTVEKISWAAAVIQLHTEVLNVETQQPVLRGTGKVRIP